MNSNPILITQGSAFVETVQQIRQPLMLASDAKRGLRGLVYGQPNDLSAELSLIGQLPALYPEWLGDRNFMQTHSLRFAYIAGEMARGIASADMVIAMAKAKMLGFFGAGGLSPELVDKTLLRFKTELGNQYAYGINLIHSPESPALEQTIVDLCLKHQVRRLSASAFMALSPAVVRYAFSGIYVNADGSCVRPNSVFAKISRPEVAKQFMSPAPAAMLNDLLTKGLLTSEEVRLAAKLPVAEQITVEADSGGHTDNRPLPVLLPVIIGLRDELRQQYAYPGLIHVGAAGGLATPAAVAGAFAMGAAYVVTGSINQSALESGLPEPARSMLNAAGIADMGMAPAGDMFEIGAKVQVLQKGSLFAQRATRLYDLYRRYDALEDMPEAVHKTLERDIFQMPLAQVWENCKNYFAGHNPQELSKAERDAHHRMALVFRWYLGQSSRWPLEGVSNRQMDYQIWCGPAMGAFNAWVKDSFLADSKQRSVVQIAYNLMEGAAVVTRAHQLRCSGLIVPSEAYQFKPRPLA